MRGKGNVDREGTSSKEQGAGVNDPRLKAEA